MRKTLILALVICFMTAFGAQAAQINKVAAVVNGQVITMFDLQKNAVPDLMRARINPNDPAQAKAVDAVLRKALDGMIMDILVAQEAKRLKVSISSSVMRSAARPAANSSRADRISNTWVISFKEILAT